MNNLKINKNNLFLKKTALLLLVPLMLILFVACFGMSTVFAAEEEISKFETKIYSNATIEDDFDDSSVIVIMDKNTGGINKLHNKSFFGDFDIDYIRDLSTITGDARSKGIDQSGFNQILQIKLPVASKKNVLKVIKQLEQVEGVKCAEPNYYGQVGLVPPNTTNYNNQWGVDGILGTLGIQAREAWDFTTGSRNVRVGIIDTGIANHVDLNVNLVAGRDFTDSGTTTDTHGHGTHVAGIIGAVASNNGGIAGVAWNVSLVPLKIATGSSWSTANAIAAINHARDLWNTNQRIHILNFSGWNFPNNAGLRDAIDGYQGLFVCIAGNGHGVNINENSSPNYPGSFNGERQITVGSLDSNGAISSFSNVGSTAVDIFAPGGSILSTVPSSVSPTGYDTYSGTSMAAPHVVGVAALLLSVNPTLTTDQLRTIILDSANNVTTLNGNCVTGGRLDAYEAIKNAIFTATTSGSNCTITGLRPGSILPSIFIIPQFINGRTVTQMGSSAMIGQNQLTQITIPSTVTSIGNDAFKNTNNASIYLEGKTKAPSTFNINWNSSNNPVYLNGHLCTHTSSTTITLDDAYHGHFCNDCRTIFSESLHNKYMSNGFEKCYECDYIKNINHSHTFTHQWIKGNLRQHRTFCSCGLSTLTGHIVSSNWNGIGYATCLECGGPAEVGFVVLDGLSKTIQRTSAIYISKYFSNGSFVLSNGVIVLSDIDLEAYYAGTLVLPKVYNADSYGDHDCEDCHNKCIDCYTYSYECLANEYISKTLYIPINKKDYIDVILN